MIIEISPSLGVGTHVLKNEEMYHYQTNYETFMKGAVKNRNSEDDKFEKGVPTHTYHIIFCVNYVKSLNNTFVEQLP